MGEPWAEQAIFDLTAMWEQGTPSADIAGVLSARYQRALSPIAIVSAAKRRKLTRRRDNPWDDDIIERLKVLWDEGLSASQIGDRLAAETGRKFTRCSVLGKVHRLKLPARLQGGQRRTKPSVPRIRSARAKVHANRGGATLALHRIKNRKRQAENYEPIDLSVYGAPESKRLSIIEVTSTQCKWPTNAEGQPFECCGQNVEEERPYCSWHTLMAYQGATQDDFDRIATKCLGGSLHQGKCLVLEA